MSPCSEDPRARWAADASREHHRRVEVLVESFLTCHASEVECSFPVFRNVYEGEKKRYEKAIASINQGAKPR